MGRTVGMGTTMCMTTATTIATTTAMTRGMITTMMMATTMGTDTTITATETPLLQLLWLASPALPVGGFSYSEGLEAAVEAGFVKDETSAGEWLVNQLHLGLARADLTVLAQAVPAWREGDAERVAALDAWMRQTRETSELRLQTEQAVKRTSSGPVGSTSPAPGSEMAGEGTFGRA